MQHLQPVEIEQQLKVAIPRDLDEPHDRNAKYQQLQENHHEHSDILTRPPDHLPVHAEQLGQAELTEERLQLHEHQPGPTDHRTCHHQLSINGSLTIGAVALTSHKP